MTWALILASEKDAEAVRTWLSQCVGSDRSAPDACWRAIACAELVRLDTPPMFFRPGAPRWHRAICRLLRPPVTNFAPRGSLLARARRWVHHVVLRYESETCDACGGRVLTSFWCDDDDQWESAYVRATGALPKWRDGCWSGLLCEPCFLREASQ